MAITAVQYVEDSNLQGLQAKVNALIADDWQPNGLTISFESYGSQLFAREMIQGAATEVGSVDITDVTGLQAALDAKVPATRTVNGHALSGNVVVSGTDITTGTVPIAQLPVATAVAKGIASFGSGLTVTAGAVTAP